MSDNIYKRQHDPRIEPPLFASVLRDAEKLAEAVMNGADFEKAIAQLELADELEYQMEQKKTDDKPSEGLGEPK